MLQPGDRIGPYRIVESVGRGGMATVYRAHHDGLDRDAAIKILPEFFAEDPSFRLRFQQEAMAIARLKHPNIVAVFDHGEDGGVLYIASEFVDGGTLADLAGSPQPVERVVTLLAPVAAALDYAHARAILHRDVKPSNILLDRDGVPELSDFGLAKMAGGDRPLTRSSAILGTPEYMAPEQATGADPGPASDQYSLGVVAYELLTGQLPFQSPKPAALILAHIQQSPPTARSLAPNLSEGTEQALLRALDKDPARRYASCAEFVQDLGGARAVTALAADLRGMKASAAALPADELMQVLYRYVGALTEAVREAGGAVDKYLGDGLIAIFDEPETGISAALAMHEKVAAINAERAAAALPVLGLAVGIDTGLEAVERARRFERAASRYTDLGVGTVLSEATAARLEHGRFRVALLDADEELGDLYRLS